MVHMFKTALMGPGSGLGQAGCGGGRGMAVLEGLVAALEVRYHLVICRVAYLSAYQILDTFKDTQVWIF